MRAGSAPHTTFAGEQVIDELAHAAEMDPVAFRIQNVTQGNDWLGKGQSHDQLLAVLNAVDEGRQLAAAGRGVEPVGRQRRHRPRRRLVERRQPEDVRADRGDRRRRGEQEDRQDHGQARLPGAQRRASPSIPAGSRTRSSAASTQILSRLLSEQYRYSKTNVTSTDFVSYPILRFKDAPKVTPIVLQWTHDAVHRRRRRAGRGGGRRPRSRTRSSTRPACGSARPRSRPRACGRR